MDDYLIRVVVEINREETISDHCLQIRVIERHNLADYDSAVEFKVLELDQNDVIILAYLLVE